MQLRYIKNVQPAQPSIARITAACWSPNNKRLAVVDTTRVVQLYDENGDKNDKFPTKAVDPNRKTYAVRAMAFSPDSTKIAIAQTDNIVFVYKIGLEAGERKTICNKFTTTSAPTCLVWPTNRSNDLVWGLAEGKVRIGDIKKNAGQTLYSSETYVVSIAASIDGNSIVSGHADGSIFKFNLNEAGQALKIITHPVVPSALAWGESIAVAGSDCKVVFYDRVGSQLQHFAYPMDEEKEFTCAAMNPTGHSLVVGGWNKFRNYNYNGKQKKWEEGTVKTANNLYSVVLMSWKHDGSRLIVASTCGSVDMFDACIRRYRYKNKFEFTYISPSQVIVKRLTTNMRIVLKATIGREIQKIDVHHDQFIVAHTESTLLMGDLLSCKLSEVPWTSLDRRERFFFDSPQVCMVYNAGELALVEYGQNEILGSARTEHINRHLLSMRILGDIPNPEEDAGMDRRKKVLAYLIDRQTIRILDLMSGVPLATVHHASRIDWLELNKRADKLLFRDKARCLYLYDIASLESKTLLSYCSYVQWVPEADVVVAQNRGDLCVWYSIDNPDRVAIVPIKGEVMDIERTPAGTDGANSPGRTEVIVDESPNTVAYALDENLIEFGTAMEALDYERACSLLEQIEMTPETESLWQNLSTLTLQEKNYLIAERCFAALGDVAKARSLREINTRAEEIREEHMQQYGTPINGYDNFRIQALIHQLNKDFRAAERVLLDQGLVDEAIEMWGDLKKIDEAIAVAEQKNHPEVENMKATYLNLLLNSNQEEKAAEMKERDHRYLEAIDLYLKGGLPAHAAHVVNTYNVQVQSQLLEAIASALMKAGMYEKAGDFFERLNMAERALDAYKKGHSYRRAVDLARRTMAGYVVTLEEAWGEYLVQQKQLDSAINHFIEAKQYTKAIEAAINSRQWSKAIQIVDAQDSTDLVTKKFYKLIATHFEDQRQYAEGEKYYVKAGLRQEAVEMWTRANQWDMAHKVAKQYMNEQEISALYINQAQQYEVQGKYKDAERLYLKVNEPDLAIHMYKKARQYDNMIRLVSMYRKELLTKTHQTLAVQLEREGNFKQAEYHYVQAKDWAQASNMYRDAGMWEDAIRCAKLNGGVNASRKVVFSWAASLGGEMGAKLLVKFGLVEQAIEHAIENGSFQHAIELASSILKSKLPYVHLKHAMFLEDEGSFKEAEEAFVRANKPKEAIDMYVHMHDWVQAMRVAETHEPAYITDVMVAQARVAFERKEYQQAEQFLLQANKPELLCKIYKEARMWADAQRVAKDHCPNRLASVNEEYAKWMQQAGDSSNGKPMDVARLWVDSGDYARAIDAYLKIGMDNHPNEAEVVGAWKQAVSLAINHCKDKLDTTLRIVGSKLCAMKRHKEAATMLQDLERWDDAVEVYIDAREWETALAIAGKLGPQVVQRVQNAQKSSLLEQGSGDALYAAGNKKEAFETWAKNNEWGKLMPKVRKENSSALLGRYSGLYVEYLCGQDKHVDAAQVVVQDGMGPSGNSDPKLLETYRNFTRGLLPHMPVAFDAFPIRDHLRQLLENMSPLKDVLQEPLDEVRKMCRIVHQYALHVQCKHSELNDISTKLIVSLLRFVNLIPADKAFADAGMAAKQLGDKGAAFVLLNHLLDVHDEAEAEGDGSGVGRGELASTDIPDVEFEHYVATLDPAKLEEVRNWVLAASLEKFEKKLATTSCPKCDAQMWDAAAQCPHCSASFETCIVTGYPILHSQDRVQCTACKSPANREDWNAYVMKLKLCPWCSNPQQGQF